jgi:oxygen-dependent protoporphyrinogen oxidase
MQMMVPTKLMPVITSRLFSPKTKWAMIREYLAPPEPLPADDDETVASFVSRHFGSEVVDRLADPLLAGVYGGNASVLSARATLPQMIDSECRYRSLVRGALAMRSKHASSSEPPAMFTSMRDGMQRIVEAITRQLPRETLRCSRMVEAIAPSNGTWKVTIAGTTEEFDQVILGLPAHGCAKLMAGIPGAERATEILGEFSYSSAMVVTLAYKSAEINLPPGFGFLVPRNEAKRMIACTFVHNKFENRAPEGAALLRVFLGGICDADVLDLSNTEVIDLVRKELREILNITAEPQLTRVFRWQKAMAQYEVGHLLRVARLEMHTQRLPGLHLSGNAFHGIGVPDCVRMGRSAADAVMRRMRALRASE